MTGTLKSPNAGNRSVEIFTRDHDVRNQDIPAVGLQKVTEAAIPPFANQMLLSEHTQCYLPANSSTIPHPSQPKKDGNEFPLSTNCKCCLQYTQPGRRHYEDNISTISWNHDNANYPAVGQSTRPLSASSIRPCLKYATTFPRQSGIRNQSAKQVRQPTAVSN